jgi:leukotriene A-4 hydrolase/aminopeptidase
MKQLNLLGLFFILAILNACKSDQQDTEKTNNTMHYADDPHSFGRPNEVAIQHLNLDLEIDFDTRTLQGSASYNLQRNGGDTLVLDIRDLSIQSVKDQDGKELSFTVEQGNESGDALKIALSKETRVVDIAYSTSPKAAAVLWMDEEQTLGKTAPFLFTQGQAILTRSWIPIQDSPALRITYDAKIKVPSNLLAVMSASNPTEKNQSGIYTFQMNKPIPPYLMALAVGDLEFRSLGARSGVYSEPAMLEAAAYEFADVEKMLEAAEELYGPYQWDRYDILVLPPSFPFGGMENPKLTFATPTIIAGDRSLTSLIAHELAHSWSGNLVTNATWDDFWLNEGFTVYFEKRIMEALYGQDYAEMLNQLGLQDLKKTIRQLGPKSGDTHLKLNLKGRNPDDGMTDIAYEKGYLFLRWLESIYGRDKFDAFLRDYFEKNAFKTMTTEKFVSYLEENLFVDSIPRPDVESWIYEPGLPENHPEPSSDRFSQIDAQRLDWLNQSIALADIDASEWSTHEWLHFLRGFDDSLGSEKMAELDKAFSLTGVQNSEKAAVWYLLAIRNDYQPAFDSMSNFLITVGRRKFLQPIYEELARTEKNKKWALEVYREARSNYHAVSVETIDEILNWDQSEETAS